MNPKPSDQNGADNKKPGGTVTIEGNYATLRYERHLAHSPEEVWKAITDPQELTAWFAIKAEIDGRPGGTVRFVTGPSGFKTTGRILVWDPPRIFEYEYHIEPHTHLPNGEPEAIIQWELVPEGNSNTCLTVTLRRLTRSTATGFAPGMHAFLDRLAARLDNEPLPDWMERYAAAKGSYPSWQG